MTVYDDWVLRGPDEPAECPDCDGTGEKDCHECGGKDPDCTTCPECDGMGVVPCEHDAADEPDGDYLYERIRDRRMEDDR